MVRQLSKLLRLPCQEVFSNFDANCSRGGKRRGITGKEIRDFCK